MSNSVCHFMPVKKDESDVKAVRFVYETECSSFKQPFVHPIYVLHMVTGGSAVLRIEGREYSLKRGDIFFAFPAFPYYLDAICDFEYIYISFMGRGVAPLLSKCGIEPLSAYYGNYGFLCPIYEDAIKRINVDNSNMLTESVLYYTLSFFSNGTVENEECDSEGNGNFESIVNYVDNHYREENMSLGMLSERFSYTEKYLSSLFKKNMHIGFISYLNNLRIQYAIELIQKRKMSIREISEECGYRDYSYFSRVFKKSTGKTPTESLKESSKTNK